jgi:serine protease Do
MLRLLTIVLVLAAAVTASARTTELVAADIAQRVTPAVVTFSIWKMRPPAKKGDEPRRIKIYGSGFVIDPNGIIVTNEHVIEGALDMMVIFNDGTRAHGTLLAAAAVIDLALVKVSVGKSLPALQWGDSDRLRVGDLVLTVGSPLGLGTSVSAGIVSALNRNLLDTPLDDYIQTDAAINRGNSGGPLIDRNGDVVGINTALYNTEPNGGFLGIGFALPALEAQFVIGRLLDPDHPRPGWLGVKLQDVAPNLAEALGLSPGPGVIISDVDPSGPAARASLQPGDVLQGIDTVSPADSRAFMRRIVMLPAGQQVILSVWRDGRTQPVPITVAEWPNRPSPNETVSPSLAEAIMKRPPDFGLSLKPISDAARKRFKLDPGASGVVITGVEVGCEADDLGLEIGDVIKEVQGSPVMTPAEVIGILTSAHEQRRPFAALLVDGKRGKRWVSLSV